MRIVAYVIFGWLLSGCATTYQTVQLDSLGESYWTNSQLLHLQSSDFQLEFSKVKGKCNVEAYKLPVPSPSCVQPPRQDCTGLTGFALGFCQSHTPQMKCDYSGVNAAKNARVEIFSSCMQASGWILQKKNGQGADISGGRFEYVAYDNTNNYYVKLGTIIKQGSVYSAIVRKVSKTNSNESYQGRFYFDISNNILTVDDGAPSLINEGSAATFLLTRIKQLI